MFGLFKKQPFRFCVDCRFFESRGSNSSIDMCMRDVIKTHKDINLVTGKKVSSTDIQGSLCEYERDSPYGWRCGPKAKFFKPKEIV